MTTRYEERAQHLVDDRWIEELREAGLSEWPRATTGEPVNTRRVYYRTHELLVDERSSDSVIGALREFGPVEVRDSNLGDVGVTILVSGAEDDALLLTRSIGRNLSGLRFAPHYIAIIAQGRPGISPATYPRSVSEAPPVEPSCDASDQCIAVADTGMWEEPSSPSRLDRANPANQVFYENGDVETVSNAPPGGNALWYGAGHGGFIGGILTARADGVPIHLGNAFDGAIHALTIESIVNCVNRLLSSKPVPTVLNLSLGTYTEPGVDVVGLRDAVERWTRKVLVVSAAGNHATTERFYPAAFAAEGHLRDLVVSVGATDPAGGQAPYSNFGEWVTAWAPGSHISFYPKGITYLAPSPDAAQTFHDGYATWDGTSFATPFVAAEITRYAIDHGLTPQQAWAAIRGATPQVVFG